MSGRVVAVTAILLVTLAVLRWLRADSSFDVREILPFLRGSEISFYDWGGLAMIVLGIWGLSRLYGQAVERPGAEVSYDDEAYEPDDEWPEDTPEE